LNNLGGLLKHYQEEIDRLTRRSKTAETSFLNLYKSLFELQDPVPIMEISLGQASQLIKFAEADQENKKLMAEQAEFAKELQGIKNQEVTVRKCVSTLVLSYIYILTFNFVLHSLTLSRCPPHYLKLLQIRGGTERSNRKIGHSS
jgi:hypothetical protein